MNALTILKTLGPIDLKNIQRDSMLIWIPLLPFLIVLLFRAGIPQLTNFLIQEINFDPTPYYPLLMSAFMLLIPSMVGMIVGFLLLDERDERVLTTLLVTPMPISSYLAYRISIPILLGTVTTLVSYPLVGIVPLPAFELLMVALLGALTGPLLALFLAAFAENKVAGLALVKMANGILMIPTVAYLIDEPWQLLAGIIPTYWPAKIFWLAAEGESYGVYLVIGWVVNVVVLGWLLRRFQRMVYRG